jgi:Leucine-rich repeat (LRR) protein
MESIDSGYLLQQGPFGLRATLTSDWSQQIRTDLLRQPIAELELNRGKGWRGRNLSFLSDFPELLALKIIGTTADSVSPIHGLHDLRALTVMTSCKTEIRFDVFPRLIECVLDWRPKAISLFECVGLKKLFVTGFRGLDASPFGKLKNLESLALLGSSIRSLEGLRPLAQLRSLRLGDMRKLETLAGVEGCLHLEKLEINTCRKVSAIEELAQLLNLQELYLDNMGEIRSLGPLASLHQLRRLAFVESTNIVDGNLAMLLNLPKLEMVAFQNRKQYTHRREDFPPSNRQEASRFH